MGGVLLRSVHLKAAPLNLTDPMDIQSFKTNNGWLWRFRKRHIRDFLAKLEVLLMKKLNPFDKIKLKELITKFDVYNKKTSKE